MLLPSTLELRVWQTDKQVVHLLSVPSCSDVVMDWRYFYDHGFCRTYMPKEGSEEPMSGLWNGYQFHFSYHPCQQGSDSVSPMLPGGMDVFVHDAKEWWTGNWLMTCTGTCKLLYIWFLMPIENPSFFYNGENLFIHNGIEAWIKLSETHYSGLDKEESPCQMQEDSKTSYSEVKRKCTYVQVRCCPFFTNTSI